MAHYRDGERKELSPEEEAAFEAERAAWRTNKKPPAVDRLAALEAELARLRAVQVGMIEAVAEAEKAT